MLSLDYLFKHGITFFLTEGEFHPDRVHYAENCLATGLREMGIPLYANVDHPLFRKRDPSEFRDGLVLFTLTQKTAGNALTQGIRQFKGDYKFILSLSDTNSTTLTPANIPSLMAHENRFMKFAGPRFPWQFGLSNEMIASGAGAPYFSQRQRTLLRNFRPSGNQSVRDALDLALVPHLEKSFRIDAEIDAGNHFDRLKNDIGCLAYGGNFARNPMNNPFYAQNPAYVEFNRHVTYLAEPFVIRWDSWRLWESFASGCLTFQLNFEKYGLALPVNPTPWVHYIPVDFADPQGTAEKLLALEPHWRDIAEAGRRWAIDNYAPKPTAQRFLAMACALYP
jgi:hypothetical protein